LQVSQPILDFTLQGLNKETINKSKPTLQKPIAQSLNQRDSTLFLNLTSSQPSIQATPECHISKSPRLN
jgi:hypothetical protein